MFFNAAAGTSVNLNLSLTGDNQYEIIVRIVSAGHGSIYNYTTYGETVNATKINQTVNLNCDDSYNITLGKHPFYSTVTISGTIDIYNNKTPNPAITPSPTQSPSPALNPEPITTISPTPSMTPSPTAIPESTNWIILIIVITTSVSYLHLRRKNNN